MKGWVDEASENEIVTRIRTFIAENDMNAKIINVACPMDLSTFGIITFENPTCAKRFL